MVRLKTAEQRLAWLADHLAEQPGVGIVYCLTVAATQEIAGYLRSRGHDVAAYSGQTETTERTALEEDLAAGRVKALIATSALGMGFDATLGFVVNMGAPQSPVAYYQQVGRAGRGTDEATVVLLPATEDRDIWAYFASLAFPREELVRQTLEALADRGHAGHGRARDPGRAQPQPARDHAQGARRRRCRPPGARRLGGHRPAVGLRRRALRAGPRGPGARAGRDARLPRHRRLPDALPARAARRPRGGRLRPLRQLRRPEPRRDRVDARRSRRPAPDWPGPAYRSSRARCGPPRWPTLGIDLKGKIAEPAEEGRAVARLTDLGHGQALRALFRPDTAGRRGPGAAGAGSAHAARRLAPRGRRDRGGGVVDPTDADRGPRRAGCPAGSRCRWSAAG